VALFIDEIGRICVSGVSETGRRVPPSVDECGRRIAARSIIITPVGGGIGGGTSPIIRTVLFAPNGGGIGGGSTTTLRSILFIPTGGGIGGGTSPVIRSVLFVPTGGGVGGGVTVPLRSVLFASSGGGIGGGAAEFTYYWYHYTIINGVVEGLYVPGIIGTFQASIIDSTLNFPSLFCILNAPGIDFDLKPAAEGLDIL
jgi:hypothetical protein